MFQKLIATCHQERTVNPLKVWTNYIYPKKWEGPTAPWKYAATIVMTDPKGKPTAAAETKNTNNTRSIDTESVTSMTKGCKHHHLAYQRFSTLRFGGAQGHKTFQSDCVEGLDDQPICSSALPASCMKLRKVATLSVLRTQAPPGSKPTEIGPFGVTEKPEMLNLSLKIGLQDGVTVQ